MTRTTAGTNQNMDYLRVEQRVTVRSSILDNASVTITRSTRDTPGHGLVDQHVNEDALMVALQLQDYHGDLWVDGRNVPFPISRRGHFTLYDYNRTWQADLRSAFDVVNFYIPRSAIDALADDFGNRAVETFNVKPGVDVDDGVVRGLAASLESAFANPAQASMLFVDHVGLALTVHMATTYGEAAAPRPVHAGGLADWQLRRATEMIDASLDGNLSLADLAAALGLSISYFTRAFRLSTGLPPYRWMLQRRIDKATALVRDTSLPLADIARLCGFVDQSHFTRLFSRAIGTSPGVWRRTRTTVPAARHE